MARSSGNPGLGVSMTRHFVASQMRTVDQVGVEERAARLSSRSIKKGAKVQGLRLAVAMMDLTSLEGRDTAGRIQSLCRKAMVPLPGSDVPHVAAVCVYPPLVSVAKRALGRSGVHVAAVATYFPSGQAQLSERLDEVRRTVAAGADEIDMVINRNAFLAGDHAQVFDEIAACKEACGKAHLKVILETGELVTYDNVRRASLIAIEAGADFIKTSTGKVTPAATLPVTLVMLETIRDHYIRTGKMVGMKPAGGIRTAKDALRYLIMVKETLGDAWLSPDWFRFGASTLLNDVLLQLEKERTGRYQSDRYLSLP
ncbi:MAG: deoxyribose-phosphate aldolase [Deltaproteobacteria bacterium]|nr:deoxyribose-phosphate aldolase [Deltaproteobacteria bacterium]